MTGWRVAAMAVLAAILAGCTAPHRVVPAPDIDCVPGPFITFFDRNAAALDKDGVEILANVRMFLNESCWKGASLGITGYRESDEAGGISRARAVVARDYFVKHGIPARRIRIEDAGSSQPRMKEVAGVQNRQNRRIEIVLTWGKAGY